MKVLYFDHCLGAAHSKCWSKSAFVFFAHFCKILLQNDKKWGNFRTRTEELLDTNMYNPVVPLSPILESPILVGPTLKKYNKGEILYFSLPPSRLKSLHLKPNIKIISHGQETNLKLVMQFISKSNWILQKSTFVVVLLAKNWKILYLK